MDDQAAAIVGQGRSGVVYRSCAADGRDVARKLFRCTGLTKLVHLVVFGAANPYGWCSQTVRSAVQLRYTMPCLEAWSDQIWFPILAWVSV